MDFNTWLDTFLEEKGIDLEGTFDLIDENDFEHHLSYAVVVEHIKITSPKEQAKIKETLVEIDFKNLDVKHYLRHLAQAIIN